MKRVSPSENRGNDVAALSGARANARFAQRIRTLVMRLRMTSVFSLGVVSFRPRSSNARAPLPAQGVVPLPA